MARNRNSTFWFPPASVITLLLLSILQTEVSIAGRMTAPAGQEANTTSCRGLHAGIRAELVRRDPPYTEPPFVMVTFVLLNDGDAPTETSAESWKLAIDGTELQDSSWIFGNGPAPTGGWGTLQPGETFQFGKALPLSKYFPVEREYRIAWKGKTFQSPTKTIRIAAKNP